MSSFYAELTVDGHAPCPVRQCQFEFAQATDQRGRVAAKVRHGLLHLTLDVPEDDYLLDWAHTAHKPLAGHVTFFAPDQKTARETVSFAAGQCVSYQETFVAGDGEAGAYVCQLLITSAGLTLTPGGAPQAFVAPAARDYAPPAAAALPAQTGPSAWLDELTSLMGPAVDVPAAVAGWVAAGLAADKLRSAMRGAVDKRLVVERLQKADKGIYQQRVVIDDYPNIPGVAKKDYINNSLPEQEILASTFGVMDPRYNLPAKKAATFTEYAHLNEVKPGDKLYRVTNDPATDPRGKTGGYWTRTPPKQLAEVIGGTAVMPEWNNFQRVYEFTAPPYADPVKQEPKFMVWEGPTAAQPVSNDYPDKKDNGYCLPGGEPQAFVSNHLAWDASFSTHIIDVTSTHKSW